MIKAHIVVFCLMSAFAMGEDLKPKNQVGQTPKPSGTPAANGTSSITSAKPTPQPPPSGAAPQILDEATAEGPEVSAPTTTTTGGTTKKVVKKVRRKSLFYRPRLSILGGTLGFDENFYDKRFSTITFGLEASFALTTVGRRAMLYANTGVVTTLSKLSITAPATQFTHYYFFFPVQLRLLYVLRRNLFLEGIAGALIRPWEYDTRSTSDGGFHSVRGVSTFAPDVGVGILYGLSPRTNLQLRISYQFLRAGIEFVL